MPTPNLDLVAEDCNKSLLIGALTDAEINDADYIAFYDTSAQSEPKQRKATFGAMKNKILDVSSVLPETSPADVGKTLIVDSNGHIALGQSLIGVSETYTIETTDWVELLETTYRPFQYKAVVLAETTLFENSSVELINDNPLIFMKYGFSIAEIQGQYITFYSTYLPDDSVELKVRIYA